jgi:2'-5' RNA ligase
MRLFVASSFPEAVTRELNARAALLKSRLPAASWVRPESQHLTYAFLGEQEESLLDTLGPALEKGLRCIRKFEARLHRSGFFPNARRARVGWVGLEPEKPFRDIAETVREIVTTGGVELDRADFRPHLTLMRIRDPWPPASIETFEKGLKDYESAPFVIGAVTLYSSRLNPSGAVHTPLRQFPLT